jgi:hypothetical protein
MLGFRNPQKYRHQTVTRLRVKEVF